MGNSSFKLPNILPNRWLSKLKNMGTRTKTRRPIIQTAINQHQAPPTPAKASPSSPTKPLSFANRPSHYIPSQTRAEHKLPPSSALLCNRTSTRKPPLMRAQALRREKQRKQSIAVVKSSSDPQKDFRDSMVEMILENHLLDSRDLEDLLASYLSLNSTEHHDMIVRVFREIWIALTELIL